MNSQPIVSVIIPVFNGAQYIRDAIESVLNQTFEDFEIIVVDDGSTDNTKAVLEAWASENKIRYIYQTNKGLGGARNTGIRFATGKFLKFLDHDDLLYPQQLEYQVRHLQNKSFNVISVTDYEMEFESKTKKTVQVSFGQGSQLARFIQGPACVVHTVLIFRSLVEQVGGFDEGLSSCEDRDFWLRILIEGCVFERINYVGCCYRILSQSLSSNQVNQLRQRCKIFEKLNQTLLSRFEQFPEDVPVQLLLSNIKLIHMCFARRINPSSCLPVTLQVTRELCSMKMGGLRKDILNIIGIKNFILLKYFKTCLKEKNYQEKLLNTTWWRNGQK